MLDRDWPQLQKVLVETLPAGDPVLDQALGISWTDGKDVLMELVFSGHTELLEWLVDHGLESNLPWGPNNSTMLHAAMQAGRSDVADILFNHGALVDARADWNTTPLLRAAASQQPGMIKWLADHGADMLAVDTNGWTALHHAALAGDLDSVKVLVDNGLMKEALNNNGHTAQDEAIDFGHQEVADYLAPQDPFENEVVAA
ncbi:hypothetical protein PR048_022580 [Dryococelus australis]|uniref:Ankyrin repeat domain-containing protein n=1 Tax=Dryococelus australis TaxID=614101 RepID=A0ABQ9H1D3_9NEOP|nr:hypothetical protein PR048_022580 [Dryococelus australis]